MKHRLMITLGLIVFGWALFVSVPSGEAAIANGTHYVAPAWDQTLNAGARFVQLSNMSNAAVLDKETGLVWEQSPSTNTMPFENAQLLCNQLKTGGRMGWRLPTLQELESLVDPSKTNPALPLGHPFSNVGQTGYWSATSLDGYPTVAWFVGFYNGTVLTSYKTNDGAVWCVRGGQGVNPQ